jgi:ABC-type Na+ efflux pump permease subunit
MSQKKFWLLIACLAFAALAVGCSDTATNTNTNTNTNANMANVNTNANANMNANANANRSLTREDVEKKKDEYAAEAKRLGRKVGAGANDTWLWVKTRADLAAAADLRDSTIEVDVENGVITLTGTVANNDQVKKADTIAKGIDGQKGVQNKLKVAADGGNANKNANTGNANTKKG